jgi:hypothetical protein
MSMSDRRPKSITSTSTPILRAISTQPWVNRPVASAKALSPREKTLDSAASQAPWPFAM